MGEIVYAMRTTSGTFAANKINHHNCNRYLNGNYEVYRKKMVAELGQEQVELLEKKAKTPNKQSLYDLELKLKDISSKLTRLT